MTNGSARLSSPLRRWRKFPCCRLVSAPNSLPRLRKRNGRSPKVVAPSTTLMKQGAISCAGSRDERRRLLPRNSQGGVLDIGAVSTLLILRRPLPKAMGLEGCSSGRRLERPSRLLLRKSASGRGGWLAATLPRAGPSALLAGLTRPTAVNPVFRLPNGRRSSTLRGTDACEAFRTFPWTFVGSSSEVRLRQPDAADIRSRTIRRSWSETAIGRKA
jgi:hypothetical protein